MAADQITKGRSTDCKQKPDPASFSKIRDCKYEHKQIKRYPDGGLTQKRKKRVKESIGPSAVDNEKKFLVKRINMCEPGMFRVIGNGQLTERQTEALTPDERLRKASIDARTNR